jgi:hypothetical protein
MALASRLAERRVSERMAATCEAALGAANLVCDIQRRHDMEARPPGANLTVWAESSSGCRFGAGRAGAPGRTSEAIGESSPGRSWPIFGAAQRSIGTLRINWCCLPHWRMAVPAVSSRK